MANSAATITVTDSWHDTKREHVVGTIALSAGNYVTNGIPITWVGLEFVKSSTNPVFASIFGVAGFNYVYDPTNASIRIYWTSTSVNTAFAEQTGGAALANGAVTDTIRFHAIFKLI